ncbi:hypothetical protein RvY_03618 [Ramazzottius varieornatus]|uniref:LIM zinc-binding domain-containing protein n=1 Tax=Ramazzottius varieornatus TaxID=947166 RepID=A0A1D1UNP9_RAMVA|nr:hypothetical protein RvY_03618 [Ramazzottius varieornatus]
MAEPVGPCAGCSEPIFRDQDHLAVRDLGRLYHINCLNCTNCRDNLRGPFSLWEYQDPLCDRCLEERSPRCEECHNPVSDMKVRTKFGYFHPDCFVCTACKFPFINDQEKTYYNVDGRPFCHRDAMEEVNRPVAPSGHQFQETHVREGF